MSFDVTLSKDVLPEYPPECIICTCPDPRSRIRVASHSVHWWTWLLFLTGLRFDAEAPACLHCARTFSKRRRAHTNGRLVVCLVAALPGTLVLLIWIRPGELIEVLAALLDPRFWIIGMCSLLLIYFPLDLLYRRLFGCVQFDVIAFGKVVTYEFDNRRYAERFAKLNGAVVGDSADESLWQWIKKRL